MLDVHDHAKIIDPKADYSSAYTDEQRHLALALREAEDQAEGGADTGSYAVRDHHAKRLEPTVAAERIAVACERATTTNISAAGKVARQTRRALGNRKRNEKVLLRAETSKRKQLELEKKEENRKIEEAQKLMRPMR